MVPQSSTDLDLEGEVLVLRPCTGVAEIVLSRPTARNALGWSMWRELRQAVEEISADDDVRAVILTGAQGVFSAGGDLKSSPARGSGQLAPVARLELAHQVVSMLYRLPKPTVAAVEGFAVGVGWSLVLACDLVISARDAFFSAPFTERGLVPDGGAAWLLVQRLGHHRTASVVLLGERLSATAAAQEGVGSRLVDPGEAATEALATAVTLAGRSGDALRLAKDLMRAAPEVTFDSFLGRELLAAALAAGGPNAKEGRLAFAEGRPPRYQTGLESTP
jgi:enoyl-CoA hydratase/carnithine racemase